MSKRKLLTLVEDGVVDGWDDPRMPTISGLRRRGFTPESIRTFCDRVGIAKRENVIDFSLLEWALRDHLNRVAHRAMAVLDPIKLVITNYPEGQTEHLPSENNPEDPAAGTRTMPFSRELWMERDDFREEANRKWFRLAPGKTVRLKSAFIVRYVDHVVGADGRVEEVHVEYFPDSRAVRIRAASKPRARCIGSMRPRPSTPKCASMTGSFRTRRPTDTMGGTSRNS